MRFFFLKSIHMKYILLLFFLSRRIETETSLPAVRRQFHGFVPRGVHPQFCSPNRVQPLSERIYQVSLVCEIIKCWNQIQVKLRQWYLKCQKQKFIKRRLKIWADICGLHWVPRPPYSHFPLALTAFPLSISLQQARSSRGIKTPLEHPSNNGYDKLVYNQTNPSIFGPVTLRWVFHTSAKFQLPTVEAGLYTQL